jgi:hypothetical protein
MEHVRMSLWQLFVKRIQARADVYDLNFLISVQTELLRLVNTHDGMTEVYIVGKGAKDAGHITTTLQIYHCNLNASEVVWSQVREYKI